MSESTFDLPEKDFFARLPVERFSELAESQLKKILDTSEEQSEAAAKTVLEIIQDVRRDGDDAVRRYTKKFDGCELDELLVTEEEFAEAEDAAPAAKRHRS